MGRLDRGLAGSRWPLTSLLAGAGLYFLAVAFVGPGFFGFGGSPSPRVDARAPEAVSAVRVLGGDGGADALAGELLWLRGHGAKLIVLEAWLDRLPQSDDVPFEAALRGSLEALPSVRARRAAFRALSATTVALDAAARLRTALKAAGPVLTVFKASPGPQVSLPAELEPWSYGVSLKGEEKALPSCRLSRLPFEGAVSAAGGAAALPPVASDVGKARAVICVGRDWLNGEGLQAALMVRGLSSEALRFHWKGAALSGLGLANRSLALNAEGDLQIPGEVPVLTSLSLDDLKLQADTQELRNKVVFFRPWLLNGRDSAAFDDQARAYLAFSEPLSVSSAVGQGAGRAGTESGAALRALAALVSVVVLAFAPLWVALPVWLALLLWAASGGGFGCFLGHSMWPGLAALCLGLAWRSQLDGVSRLAAERLFRGRLAPEHWMPWWKRLRSGNAALEAACAVVGPRALLRGAQWEAWMSRWGVLLYDELPADATACIIAGPAAEETLARAILDARRHVDGLRGGLALGTLSFGVEERLGLPAWRVDGPALDGALELYRLAGLGQMLVAQTDAMGLDAFLEIRPLTGSTAESDSVASFRADAVLKVIGPNVDLWAERP